MPRRSFVRRDAGRRPGTSRSSRQSRDLRRERRAIAGSGHGSRPASTWQRDEFLARRIGASDASSGGHVVVVGPDRIVEASLAQPRARAPYSAHQSSGRLTRRTGSSPATSTSSAAATRSQTSGAVKATERLRRPRPARSGSPIAPTHRVRRTPRGPPTSSSAGEVRRHDLVAARSVAPRPPGASTSRCRRRRG